MRWTTRAATAIGAAALAVGVLSPTPAHAADEWNSVSVPPDFGEEDEWSHRYPKSFTVGASAELWIGWQGNRVYMDGWVWDNDNDGAHAELRIRYQIYANGAWSGWHYRTAAAAYGNGDDDDTGIQVSRYPTRYLQMSACVYNGDALVRCDPEGWR